MKKCLGLLLGLMLVVLAGTAFAQTVNPVPADRVAYSLYEGLEGAATHSYQNGVVKVEIDTRSADWKTLTNTGRNPCVYWSIAAPEGIGLGDYALWLFWSYDEDFVMPGTQYMLSQLQQSMNASVFYQIDRVNSDGSVYSQDAFDLWQPEETRGDVNFAYIEEEIGYVRPANEGLAVMVVWFKAADGQPDLSTAVYERLDVAVTNSSLNAIKLEQPKQVKASRIIANPWDGQQEKYDFKAETGHAIFTYHTRPEEGSSYYASYWVEAPAGATHYAWKNATGGTVEELVNDNDKNYASNSMSTSKRAVIGDEDIVTFYRETDDGFEPVGEEERCAVSLYPVDSHYWPAYDSHFHAIPESRIVFENTAAGAGFTYSYDDFGTDNEKIGQVKANWGKPSGVPGTAALEGGLKTTVKAPEGYGYYRFWMRGSGGWRGNMGENSRYFVDVETELNQSGYGEYPVLSVAEDGLPMDEFDAFRKITPADNPNISVYTPTVQGPDMLMAMILYWYDNPEGTGEPYREYLWRTDEGGLQVTYITPVSELADFHDHPQYGEQPMFQGPPGHEDVWGEWQLMVTTYYQAGTNARHYELALLDKDGYPVQPKWKVFIYLPYRDGLTFETVSGKQFTLRHYDGTFYEDSETAPVGEEITIVPTEYGLLYETDSFSPFIVSWQDEAAEDPIQPVQPEVPATGDASAPAAWTVLLILALAGVLALMKRKMTV